MVDLTCLNSKPGTAVSMALNAILMSFSHFGETDVQSMVTLRGLERGLLGFFRFKCNFLQKYLVDRGVEVPGKIL